MEQLLDSVSSIAREILEKEDKLPPRLVGGPSELEELAGISPGAGGHSREEVIEALRRVVLATPSSAGASFYNQLFGGRDPVAVVAEMLTPLLNTSMYTFKVAGPQVLIEEEIIEKMLAKAGFPEGEGILLPGGSMANLTAMLAARNLRCPEAREKGLGTRSLRAYTSELSHYSIRKNAGILGIGRESVATVPVDEGGRMDSVALQRMIREDLEQGFEPFFINATAGTTVLGAYDPIEEIARIASRQGIWLHVDGALGGSALLSTRYRGLMRGIEKASSLAWNAHKMMGMPLSCSAILLRDSGILQSIYGETAGYLFQADEDRLNPGTRSLQCGRRNDALKLWAAWLHHGDQGWDRRMTRLFDLSREAARKIAADPDFELLSQPESVNICFCFRGQDSAAICERLDRDSILKIGHGEAFGRSAIRLVCINPELEASDIDRVLESIRRVAKEL